jgi:hypothetical protein
LGEPSAGGAFSDRRPFLPGAGNENHLSFLHPQFLQGEGARDFIGLLAELSETDRWNGIFDYLHKRTPLTLQDLQDARDRFAPELLFPAELQPLYKILPPDADKAELDYLAVKIADMDERRRTIFDAAIEAGWHCDSVAEIINLTENIDCFDLEPAALNTSLYGAFRLENDWEICEAAARRLEESEDPGDRFLAKYITLLNRCTDDEAYGYHAAKDDGGAFTKHGYITNVRDIDVIYRGVHDIPAEYGVQPPAAPEQSPAPQAAQEQSPQLIMVKGTDLPALLLGMHAVGGEYMRDAKYNLKTLADKGDDFFIMMNAHIVTVTPADFAFRRDMHENEMWMQASGGPDFRAFVMSVTDRADGKITGNMFEADLWSLQDYISDNSFYFTHLDAEMKDGTSRRFSLDEWDAMDRYERGQLKSWKKHYDPDDEAALATYFSALRWAVEENRRPVSAGEFLTHINERYMALACNPQPDMLRTTPEAAKEILAQGAAAVYRLMPDGMEKLSPIDALKVPTYQFHREFAVKSQDIAGLEKWAHRAAGDVLRQNEREERIKTKGKGEEL